jgi:TonB family protein
MRDMRRLQRICSTALAALVSTWGVVACGEVVRGPETAPQTPPPEEENDLGEITDGELAGEHPAGGGEAGDPGLDEGAEDGPPDVGGGDKVGAPRDPSRDMTLIADIVKKHRQPVRDCYEAAAKKHPGLQGNLVIHFEIDPEGKVTSAKLNEQRSKIKEPELVECAVKVIKGLKFPASPKGMITEVNYPYNFKPKR